MVQKSRQHLFQEDGLEQGVSTSNSIASPSAQAAPKMLWIEVMALFLRELCADSGRLENHVMCMWGHSSSRENVLTAEICQHDQETKAFSHI